MIVQSKSDQVNESLCIIAIGSNLSHRLKGEQSLVDAALELLSSESLRILKTSALYHSPAFPTGSGPDYTNGVVLCTTTLARDSLLQMLHRIEKNLGRIRTKRWASRVIDLDLIDYAGQVSPDLDGFKKWFELPLKEQMQQTPEQLILPHPRLQDRLFVLIPMRDIAPNWVHPVTNLSVSQMLGAFKSEELTEIQRIKGRESAS